MKCHWIAIPVLSFVLALPTIATPTTRSLDPSFAADQPIAFVNVNLIPMTSNATIPGQTVVIQNARILRVGPSVSVAIPEGAHIIDGENQYLLPGLADMHVHLEEFDYPVPTLHMFLAKGVTTVRDLDGVSGNFIFRWKNEVDAGLRVGPRIIAGSPIWHYSPGNIPAEVFKQKSTGFEFIKIYSEQPKGEFFELMHAANSLKMYVVGHIPLSVGLQDTIRSGLDELAHVSEIRRAIIPYDMHMNFKHSWQWSSYFNDILLSEFPAYADCTVDSLNRRYGDAIVDAIEELASAGIAVMTTLNHDGHLREIDLPAFLRREGVAYLRPEYVESLRRNYDRNRERWSGREHLHILQQNMDRLFVRRLHEAKVPLVLGTDVITAIGNLPGFAVHQELRILVDYGLSPYDAIRAGTVNASRVVAAMHGEDDFGTVEVGKRADLVLTARNPLEDVENVQQIVGVMAAGIWYPRDELEEMIKIDDAKRPRPASVALLELIEKEGVERAIKEFWRAKYTTDNDHGLLINPYEMNRLGYALVEKGRLEDALEVFRVVVVEYPYNANAWDSLGEVYMLMGERQLAIANYEKALDIERFKESSIEALNRLRNEEFARGRVK